MKVREKVGFNALSSQVKTIDKYRRQPVDDAMALCVGGVHLAVCRRCDVVLALVTEVARSSTQSLFGQGVKQEKVRS